MKFILLSLLISFNVFSGFPQGNHEKMYKDALQFKSILRTIFAVDNDPSSVATPGEIGDIALHTSGAYFKTDSGTSTNWLIFRSGLVDLESEIEGVLPVANGGTNSSTALTNGFLMSSESDAIVESGVSIDGNDNLATNGDITVNLGEDDEFLLGDNLYKVMSTGLDEPNGLSINSGDDTTYDIASTEGKIIDTTLGTYVPISYAGSTGNSPATANGVTYVYLDNTGSISTETTRPTPEDKREKLYLGRVVTVGGTVVQTLSEPVVVENIANSVSDLARALGLFNQEGNIITANGANLNLDKSIGKIFSYGANYTTNRNNPHEVTTNSCTTCTFAYITQDAGSTGSDTTSVVPGSYDDGGTITTIGGGSNSSTVQRIYLFPSGNIRIAYGQTVYTSLSNALESISTDSFIPNPSIEGNGVLIAYLVLNKNATDLSDSSEAIFIYPNKFGGGTAEGATIGTSSLQDAYDNSVDGSILLDSTRDGVQISDASSPILASLFAVLDFAGTTTYFNVAQDGVTTDVDINMNGTGGLGLASGTTAQRPLASAFKSRGNTDLGCKEYYYDGQWKCQADKNELEINFIEDGSFEDKELAFTCTEGLSGSTYPSWTVDDRYYKEGVNETLYSATSNVPGASTDIEFEVSIDRTGLDNKPGLASFILYTIDEDMKACIRLDGGTECESGTIISLISGSYEPYEIPFIFGASSVELVIYKENTASSIGFNMDLLKIRPRPVGYIQSINDVDTDWVSYTPTFTGFGTVSTEEFEYKRVGDSIIIRGNFTCGTPTATEAQISLPNSVSVKSGISLSSSGVWFRDDGSSLNFKGGSLLITGGDDFLNFADRRTFSDTSTPPLTPADGNLTCSASGQSISFTTTQIPIEGWQTGRVDAFSQKADIGIDNYYQSSATSVGTSFTTVVFNVASSENTGNYCNTTTGVCTADKSGFYTIKAESQVSASANQIEMRVYKNSSDSICYTRNRNTQFNESTSVNCTRYLEKDDTFVIQMDSQTAGDTSTREDGSYLDIKYNPTSVEVIGKFHPNSFPDKYSETEIEYGTWNGEMLYRRCFTVDSDIGASNTTITTWDSGLTPINVLMRSGGNNWLILIEDDGTDLSYIQYEDDTGAVVGNGSYFTIPQGASYCMDYVR